jgi:hypothetical protein
MTAHETAALLKLAERLEETARALRALASSPEASEVPKARAVLPDGFVDSLRAGDREGAVRQLSELTQRQLGAVFVEAGGAARDKKRPKDWLIDRILWHLFDFNAGHDIIRRT